MQRQTCLGHPNFQQSTTFLIHNSNEHAYTFSELERIVGDEDADLDKLNLLLDLIQSRIGANAKERQANLDYNFKQIINSMFPAMHRYFMHCAVKNQDIFQQPLNRDNLILTANSWTRDNYKTINMSELQFDKLRNTKLQFLMKRKETIARIERLKSIKCELKKQGQIFEAALRDIRQEMTPVQSALIIIFGEKNKLRRQFSILTEQFQDQVMPTKHVKCDDLILYSPIFNNCMRRFFNDGLQDQYEADPDFKKKVEHSEEQYLKYMQNAKSMSKENIMTESFLEQYLCNKNQAVYFLYGHLQPPPGSGRTKLLLNFLLNFVPQTERQFIFVYFNHNTPSADYYYEFKNIFLLLPLRIQQKMKYFVMVKPSFYIKASEMMSFSNSMNKYFGDHYKSYDNCQDLCHQMGISVHQFVSFVPEIVSKEFPVQFKRPMSLSRYRINLNGQNMTEEQIHMKTVFEKTIQALIQKPIYRLQNYQVGELGIPVVLHMLILHFKDKPQGLLEQGIFRKSVSVDEVQETLSDLCRKKYEYLEDIDNPFLIASLIKKFFANLIQPIISFECFEKLMHDQGVGDKKEHLKNVIQNVPELNILTLVFLIDFLKNDVISKQNYNKMNSHNISICFSPCLMWARQASAADIVFAMKAVIYVEILINDFDFIFGDKQARNQLFQKSMLEQSLKFQETIKQELIKGSVKEKKQQQMQFTFGSSKNQCVKEQSSQYSKNRKISLEEVANQIEKIEKNYSNRKKSCKIEQTNKPVEFYEQEEANQVQKKWECKQENSQTIFINFDEPQPQYKAQTIQLPQIVRKKIDPAKQLKREKSRRGIGTITSYAYKQSSLKFANKNDSSDKKTKINWDDVHSGN